MFLECLVLDTLDFSRTNGVVVDFLLVDRLCPFLVAELAVLEALLRPLLHLRKR